MLVQVLNSKEQARYRKNAWNAEAALHKKFVFFIYAVAPYSFLFVVKYITILHTKNCDFFAIRLNWSSFRNG